MLEPLITSRTRIKLLLKFFTNSSSTAHLRALAKEMHESTNSVRLELNKLSQAGILVSYEYGKTIQYKANDKHPLFPELSSVVRKYLGIDKIIENIVKQLGDVQYAILTGDYAEGKDSGTIEILIVGEADKQILDKLVQKTETLIKRKMRVNILNVKAFEVWKRTTDNKHSVVLWSNHIPQTSE